MKFLSTTMIAATAVALLATGIATQGQAQDAAGAVKERVALMKGMGGANAQIAKATEAKETVAPAQTIQGNAQKLAGLFPAGTMTPDSRAKAEIWSNNADFKVKLGALQTAATQLVAAAQKGDLEGVKAQQKLVGATCAGCHDAYRGPAK